MGTVIALESLPILSLLKLAEDDCRMGNSTQWWGGRALIKKRFRAKVLDPDVVKNVLYAKG